MTTCDFRPFPGNGAYGHWTCSLPEHHRGRHRFRNYTIARVPRLDRGCRVVAKAWWRQRRRVVAYIIKFRRRPRVDLTPNYRSFWDRAIWPTKYEPQDSRYV